MGHSGKARVNGGFSDSYVAANRQRGRDNRARVLRGKKQRTTRKMMSGQRRENCYVPKGCPAAGSGWQEGTVKASVTTGGRGKFGTIIKWIFRCLSET